MYVIMPAQALLSANSNSYISAYSYRSGFASNLRVMAVTMISACAYLLVLVSSIPALFLHQGTCKPTFLRPTHTYRLQKIRHYIV